MQHMTMDEHFDRVLEELCWTYYATCLPQDRTDIFPLLPPIDAVDFTMSPLVSVTLLDRYPFILADRIQAMAIHKRDLQEIRSWLPNTWKRLSPEDRRWYCEEAATYEAYLRGHRRRMKCLSVTPARLQQRLAMQGPWIWPCISAAHREELLLVAGWCKHTGRLQEEVAPPRAITPAMAAAHALASDQSRLLANKKLLQFSRDERQ